MGKVTRLKIQGAIRAAWLGLVLACVGAVAAPAQVHLTFCYDPYPPYTFGTQGAPTGGLKVTLLEAVVARMDGVTADVVLLPWARCQEQARAGAVDGILPLFISEGRAEYLAFSDATFEQTSALWYRVGEVPGADAWTGNYAELANRRLGLLNGAVIDPQMEAAFAATHPIQRANGVASLFDMLRFGRVDFAAMDAKVGEYHLAATRQKAAVRAMPVMIAPRTAHFGLSKASGADRYLNAFNAALRAMHADGEIMRIYAGGW